MIRGAVYRVDLGQATRGHEQRGRRYGLVLSPSGMPWSVVTVIPTSTSAQPAIFRPEIEVAGVPTRFRGRARGHPLPRTVNRRQRRSVAGGPG